MSDPNRDWTWDDVKAHFPIGAMVEGTIVNVPHYGVWVDLGVGFMALMRIPECGLGRGQQTADWFVPGQSVTAKVIWHDDKAKELNLSRRA